MPIKYVGRKSTFQGKTLWEILGNLKNFGVGRIVARSTFQRYAEPTYLKILKVAALPTSVTNTTSILDKFARNTDRKVVALVQTVFRGIAASEPKQLDGASYKADFFLIPKDQEVHYTAPIAPPTRNILPRTMEFPPLLKRFLLEEQERMGADVSEEPQLSLVYCDNGVLSRSRVAQENETPTIKFSMGLGTPASPSLYANVKPI